MPLKRITSLVLAALLAAVCIGCSKKEPNTITAGGEKYTFDYVMKIEGEEISLAEYRYYFLNLKLQYDRGDDSYWTAERAAKLKEETEEYLLISRAVLEFARQEGVQLTREDYDAIDAEMDALLAHHGKKGFKEMLEQNFTTEALYRKFLETNAIQTRLHEQAFLGNGKYAINDDDMRQIVKTQFVRVRYLMLPTDKEGNTNRTLIASYLDRINAGEDFVEMVNAYGQEPSMNANPDGIYFCRGMTDPDFENACYSLAINEISGVVEGKNGYYIIKRLEPEDAYITESLDILRNNYQQVIFTEKVSAIADGMYVEFAPNYDKLGIETIE